MFDYDKERKEQATLSDQETDLPLVLTDRDMQALQSANLYFIVDDLATPNYRYCKPEAPAYRFRIGLWRMVEKDRS